MFRHPDIINLNVYLFRRKLRLLISVSMVFDLTLIESHENCWEFLSAMKGKYLPWSRRSVDEAGAIILYAKGLDECLGMGGDFQNA